MTCECAEGRIEAQRRSLREEFGKQTVQILVTLDILLSVVLLISFLHKDEHRFFVLNLPILLEVSMWYNYRNLERGGTKNWETIHLV